MLRIGTPCVLLEKFPPKREGRVSAALRTSPDGVKVT
jgi:hypothetical protein